MPTSEPPQPPAGPAAVCAALSLPRLGPYLALVGGNQRAAVRLYQWNVELSGALYESLHVLEVVLRNAVDRELCRWNAAQRDPTGRLHSPDWLLDPAHLLVRLTRDDIATAQSRAMRAVRGRRVPGHADVVAQTTFGTWRFLMPDRDPGRRLLWCEAVRHAFPHHAGTPDQLRAAVQAVHRTRNRIAHLEPVLDSSITRATWRQVRVVVRGIDPEVEEWLVSRQRVTQILRSRPVAARP